MNKKKSVWSNGINGLILVTLLYIFRSAIPFFKYPFILIFLYVFVFSLCYYPIRIRKEKFIVRSYWIIYVMLFLIFIGIFRSQKVYLVIIKDLFSCVILIILLLFHSYIIENSLKLKDYYILILNYFVVFSIIISFSIILNFLEILSGKDLISQQFSIGLDYNFTVIPVFYGFISIILRYKESSKKLFEVGNALLLFLFTIAILISGSRRALTLFILIISFLLLINILFYKSRKVAGITSKLTRLYLTVIVLGGILFFSSIKLANYRVKGDLLKLIGIQNTYEAKMSISNLLYRYVPKSAIPTKEEFHSKLWSLTYDAANPESGWGSRISKSISNLPPEGRNALPLGIKGYFMDNTCNSSFHRGNSYSFTRIGNFEVLAGDSVCISSYCYISEDFDGSWARISIEGEASLFQKSEYDLSKKGQWQYLNINCLVEKSGRIVPYLYWAKTGVKDFSSLSGFIIYAYPQFIVYRNGKEIDAFLKPNKCLNQKIPNKKRFLRNCSFCKKRSYTDLINEEYKLSMMLPQFAAVKDQDIIREMIGRIVNEDSTYYGYNSNLRVNTSMNNFIWERLSRWSFAWQIFINEYNWNEKILGSGFDYLNWYGYYFYNDKKRSDWPHNPFLSVLLYSGIIGLIVFLFFIYKVFYYYWKYRKEYPLFGIFFLITFYFSFFSSNGPFTPPVMGFLSILPFFIHYIHTKDERTEIARY